MLSRRRFLGHTALGMLAATAGCRPPPITSSSDRGSVLSRLDGPLAAKSRLVLDKNRLLGYPVNMTTPPDEFFAWRRQLTEVGIGTFTYNNVGNPFVSSATPYNTHDFEREVILRFGELFGFSKQNIWGFLSHSGTDSNMHGMYLGRTILKQRTGVMPKAYFTQEAHYSIQILQDLLGLDSVIVRTEADGTMDPDDLRQKLKDNADHPALVVATIGTTFKGAIDPLDLIQEALRGHPSYLHADAALFGGYLPYTSHWREVLQRSTPAAAERYHSIAISCHKFFGFPAPAGLFITSERNFGEFIEPFSRVHSPEYIGHVPGTITCSRDAVKPAEFYFFTTDSAKAMLTESAQTILQRAAWLFEEMRSSFPQIQAARSNDRSNIIYFRKPGDAIVKKYSLATMRLEADKRVNDYAHVVVMPHANMTVLTGFLDDLQYDSTVSS